MRAVRLSLLAALLLAAACVQAPTPVAGGEATAELTVTPAGVTDGYPRIEELDLSAARSINPLAGEQGTIRYRLSAAARVRIRIVDSQTPGMVWRTLIDWPVREAGAQSEPWDGLDRHGEPLSPRRVSFILDAEPARERLTTAEREMLAALPHPEHKHFAHSAEACRDLNVHLLAPAEGAPLSGVILVTAALEGQPGLAGGSEYHVVVYLAGRDAWDGRVSEPRLSQEFDTRNVPDGEYLLAVTFNDLHDHAGSDWVRVTVSN